MPKHFSVQLHAEHFDFEARSEKVHARHGALSLYLQDDAAEQS